jgi:UDP-glucose 4-epimerase
MYLITGGAGFIGSNLVESFLKEGANVRILDDFSTGRKENIAPLIEKYGKQLDVLEGSICSPEDCKKALKNIKFVSHLAAIPSVPRSIDNPIETNDANITGTLNFLQTARNFDGLEKITFAGSSSAYGNASVKVKEETLPLSPLSPYAAQKVMGESYVMLFNELFGLPTVVFRYFNVFGPKQDPNSQYSAVIPLFVKALLDNKAPTIYGDGEQSRDFTYVENITQAHKKVFASKVVGEIMNIACGTQISLNMLVNDLKEIIGTDVNPNYSEPRQGDVKHSLAGISKAKKLIDYEPVVSIKEGLEKTTKWYKEN